MYNRTPHIHPRYNPGTYLGICSLEAVKFKITLNACLLSVDYIENPWVISLCFQIFHKLSNHLSLNTFQSDRSVKRSKYLAEKFVISITVYLQKLNKLTVLLARGCLFCYKNVCSDLNLLCECVLWDIFSLLQWSNLQLLVITATKKMMPEQIKFILKYLLTF